MSKVCELKGNQLETEDHEVIKIGTPMWRRWLEYHSSFHYNPKAKSQQGFTARKEKSRGRATEVDYWYGYRKVEGKLHKRYIVLAVVAPHLDVADRSKLFVYFLLLHLLLFIANKARPSALHRRHCSGE